MATKVDVNIFNNTPSLVLKFINILCLPFRFLIVSMEYLN